jgi:hypothetical protein
MKLLEIYLKEVLVNEVWGEIEESLQIDEAITGKLSSLLKQADELIFEPFGITKDDHKKYLVSGSGRLYLYPAIRKAFELTEPGDLDLVIPGKQEWVNLKNYLQKNGTWEKHKSNYEKGIYRPSNEIEAFKAWNPPGISVGSTDQILANSSVVDGYSFMSFRDIVDYKMKLSRPKEESITKLLLKYKNETTPEAKEEIIDGILKLVGKEDTEGNEQAVRDLFATN